MKIRCSVILTARQLGLMVEWFVEKAASTLGYFASWKEKNDDHDNII
jgi:hypothetical protein